MSNSNYIKYDSEDGLPISYISKEDYITKANTIKGTTLYFIDDEPKCTNVTDTYKSSLDELYERIMTELTYKPIVEHKCNNCGAPLKMDTYNHLFKCKYCGTAYLIGTKQVNSI